jgi:hypothetical protein
MKILTILSVPLVAVAMASTVLARDYEDLVAEGYRWVSIDGPYACPAKEDLRRMSRDTSDTNELHMVEQVRAFYLIQGALVKVIQEDGNTGMVQIRAAGITSDLWTYKKFLSRLPIKDAYAVIETPETSGLVPAERSAQMGAVQGATDLPPPPLPTTSKRLPKAGAVSASPVPGFEVGNR